ncbi:MAG: glycosyltransferase [Patescibacteria group bacterium]
MKVLYVITKSNWGGAQKYLYELATSLPDGIKPFFALGGTGKKGENGGLLLERLQNNPATTNNIFFVKSFARDINLFDEIKSFFELYKIIRKVSPDILHLNSSKAGGTGAFAARITGVKKIIFTVHGFAFNEDRSPVSKILIRLLSWITMILATDIILLSNRELAQASAFPFTKKKLHLTHNGIDAISSENSTQANTEIRDSFPQDSIIVGTIGELHPNKNQVALIEAAKLLPDKICFAIVGEGELRKNLENRISELKLNHRVKLFGFIKAYEAFPNFDIFVLPSIKEGLPFTILESAIAGIPVIASNVGGIPEIIEDKHSGILVEQKDPEALTNAINTLTNDLVLRARYSKNLNQTVLSKFSQKEMVSQTISLYQN